MVWRRKAESAIANRFPGMGSDGFRWFLKDCKYTSLLNADFVTTHPNLRISEIRRSLRGDSGLRLMLDKLRCLGESRQFRYKPSICG